MAVAASRSNGALLRGPGLSIPVAALTAAGFALTVLVFHPGYATVDAQYVYAEAKAWRFGDWHAGGAAGIVVVGIGTP